ncbi:heavy-metal-associated domain-containing protein [Streptomyces sp. DSM 42041]|uniref:Heavy-metal-associated domain-containing protein n=1 Tax=Streptomyces hazeniae TaxID=3075538 RepID=A0ABU2NLA1_9ACTN|nr:heavy-metal-associated domain-containing protein [Streptomyces sp. DSM 42041]MDT0377742.1 heavy-metal-associated domain-containing protein [Streptomyces sp. DSM 42041]
MSTVTTTYKVTGMSCGHCEKAVAEEVGGVAGVTAVQADAKSSLVTVTSAAEPDDTAIGVAVDEAGYELVGRT